MVGNPSGYRTSIKELMHIKTITKKDYNEYIITYLHKIKTKIS